MLIRGTGSHAGGVSKGAIVVDPGVLASVPLAGGDGIALPVDCEDCSSGDFSSIAASFAEDGVVDVVSFQFFRGLPLPRRTETTAGKSDMTTVSTPGARSHGTPNRTQLLQGFSSSH